MPLLFGPRGRNLRAPTPARAVASPRVGWAEGLTGSPPKHTPGERAATPLEPPAQRGRNHHWGILLTLALTTARRQPNTMGDEQLTEEQIAEFKEAFSLFEVTL